MIHIVLLEPEIPENTGNIGRTCVAAGACLHLIEPLGFQLTDRKIKSAGLDYWPLLNVTRYMNVEEFREKNPEARPYMATTKSPRNYTDVQYPEDCWIMFGKESAGIPEKMLIADPDYCIRIPMKEEIRSLNLSNSVAIILYEAQRQNGFKNLQEQGELHKLKW